MKKVLVFGVFDNFHSGHEFLLRSAKKLGTYLVVAVAPNRVVEELKGKQPQPSSKRIQAIKDYRIADEVVLGDEEIGSWKILKRHKPDIIALGYDQGEIKESLEEYYENLEKKPTILTLAKKS